MRLIDADELIKGRVENDMVRIAAMCAPTAFDMDKVVEQLEEMKNDMLSEDEFGDRTITCHYVNWAESFIRVVKSALNTTT